MPTVDGSFPNEIQRRLTRYWNADFLKIEFTKVKQIDAVSLLAKSSSSTKLMELENHSEIVASGASLQNLVQLDSDITDFGEYSKRVDQRLETFWATGLKRSSRFFKW